MRLHTLGVLTLGIWLLGTATAAAQSPDSVILDFYDAQAPTGVVSTFTVPFTAFQCDQPGYTLPAGAIRNPYLVVFDDPARPGRTCRWDSRTAPATGQGPLFALPIRQAGYIARASFVTGGAQSDRSDDSNPFFRTPGRPTTLRVGG